MRKEKAGGLGRWGVRLLRAQLIQCDINALRSGHTHIASNNDLLLISESETSTSKNGFLLVLLRSVLSDYYLSAYSYVCLYYMYYVCLYYMYYVCLYYMYYVCLYYMYYA